MNNNSKNPTKSVHFIFEEELYNQLKEYADSQEKSLTVVVKGAVKSLINSGFDKINLNEMILINRLNMLEEEVINLRKELEELKKEIEKISYYVYQR